MNETLKAYKFKIYPTNDQQQKLNQTFGCVRFVWNKLVESFNSWTPEYTPEKIDEQTLKRSGDFLWLYEEVSLFGDNHHLASSVKRLNEL